MDHVRRLQKELYSDDALARRHARRAQRERKIYAQLQEAVADASGFAERQAYMWGFDRERGGTRKIEGHPGLAATSYVTETLGEFDIKGTVRALYAGMERKAGHGQHGITEGTIRVAVEVTPIRGMAAKLDIPVYVKDGHMLQPGLMFHQGAPYVISQSALTDVIEVCTYGEEVKPDRRHMYSLPQARRAEFSLDAAAGDVNSLMRRVEYLRSLATHPGTPPHEAEAATRQLSLMLDKLKAMGVSAPTQTTPSSTPSTPPLRGRRTRSPSEVKRRQDRMDAEDREWAEDLANRQKRNRGAQLNPAPLNPEMLERRIRLLEGVASTPGAPPAQVAQAQKTIHELKQQLFAARREQASHGVQLQAAPGAPGKPNYAEGLEAPPYGAEPDWEDEGGADKSWDQKVFQDTSTEPTWGHGQGGQEWEEPMTAEDAAGQFLHEHPGFRWDESEMPLVYQYAEDHDVEIPDLIDAMNDMEHRRNRVPAAPASPSAPPQAPGNDYESMGQLHPFAAGKMARLACEITVPDTGAVLSEGSRVFVISASADGVHVKGECGSETIISASYLVA